MFFYFRMKFYLPRWFSGLFGKTLLSLKYLIHPNVIRKWGLINLVSLKASLWLRVWWFLLFCNVLVRSCHLEYRWVISCPLIQRGSVGPNLLLVLWLLLCHCLHSFGDDYNHHFLQLEFPISLIKSSVNSEATWDWKQGRILYCSRLSQALCSMVYSGER